MNHETTAHGILVYEEAKEIAKECDLVIDHTAGAFFTLTSKTGTHGHWPTSTHGHWSTAEQLLAYLRGYRHTVELRKQIAELSAPPQPVIPDAATASPYSSALSPGLPKLVQVASKNGIRFVMRHAGVNLCASIHEWGSILWALEEKKTEFAGAVLKCWCRPFQVVELRSRKKPSRTFKISFEDSEEREKWLKEQKEIMAKAEPGSATPTITPAAGAPDLVRDGDLWSLSLHGSTLRTTAVRWQRIVRKLLEGGPAFCDGIASNHGDAILVSPDGPDRFLMTALHDESRNFILAFTTGKLKPWVQRQVNSLQAAMSTAEPAAVVKTDSEPAETVKIDNNLPIGAMFTDRKTGQELVVGTGACADCFYSKYKEPCSVVFSRHERPACSEHQRTDGISAVFRPSACADKATAKPVKPKGKT